MNAHTTTTTTYIQTISKTCLQTPTRGFTRIVMEKPFGRDLYSYRELRTSLGNVCPEPYLYRIDHYLGKTVVQGLWTLRFTNKWLESIWSNKTIRSVYIVWKEMDSLENRGGGYFDNYGIVRDVLQNHLLQLLTLVAMERPAGDTVDAVRNAKICVLETMDVIQQENVLLGQYNGYGMHVNHVESTTPTYAMVACRVRTPRWNHVPFVMEAGKALNENVCEVRMQFHSSKNAPVNELVLRLQPNPAVYIRCVQMAVARCRFRADSIFLLYILIFLCFSQDQHCKAGTE